MLCDICKTPFTNPEFAPYCSRTCVRMHREVAEERAAEEKKNPPMMNPPLSLHTIQSLHLLHRRLSEHKEWSKDPHNVALLAEVWPLIDVLQPHPDLDRLRIQQIVVDTYYTLVPLVLDVVAQKMLTEPIKRDGLWFDVQDRRFVPSPTGHALDAVNRLIAKVQLAQFMLASYDPIEDPRGVPGSTLPIGDAFAHAHAALAQVDPEQLDVLRSQIRTNFERAARVQLENEDSE